MASGQRARCGIFLAEQAQSFLTHLSTCLSDIFIQFQKFLIADAPDKAIDSDIVIMVHHENALFFSGKRRKSPMGKKQSDEGESHSTVQVHLPCPFVSALGHDFFFSVLLELYLHFDLSILIFSQKNHID